MVIQAFKFDLTSSVRNHVSPYDKTQCMMIADPLFSCSYCSWVVHPQGSTLKWPILSDWKTFILQVCLKLYYYINISRSYYNASNVCCFTKVITLNSFTSNSWRI